MAAMAAVEAAAGTPRVRWACDSDELAALIGTDFVRTYSDLIPDRDALAALERRFAGSAVELIDRGLGDPTGLASIADVERGSLTVADVPGWLDRKHAAGVDWLTLYSAEASLEDVIAAAAGRSHWNWAASWGRMTVAHPAAGQVQCANSAMLGLHIDLTVIWETGYRPAAWLGAARKDADHAMGALADATDLLGSLRSILSRAA